MSDDRVPGAGDRADPGPRLPGPRPPWRHGRPWGSRARRYPWPSAVLVALAQVAGSTVAAHNQPGREPLGVLGYALLLAGPALLVLRRRAPVAVAAGTAAVLLVYLTAGYPYGPVFLSVITAFFTAMAAGHRRAVLTVAGVLLAEQPDGYVPGQDLEHV